MRRLLSLSGPAVRVGVPVLTISAYTTYAAEAPPRIGPSPDGMVFVSGALLLPYAVAVLVVIRGDPVRAMLWEAAHLASGLVIALLFVASVATIRRGDSVPGPVRAIYPVALLWMMENAFACVAAIIAVCEDEDGA